MVILCWNWFYAKNALFGAVKLTKMLILISILILDMVFQFIVCENLSFSNDGFDNSVIKFGAELSSSAHFDSKKQDILISAKGLTQWLDNTTLTSKLNT